MPGTEVSPVAIRVSRVTVNDNVRPATVSSVGTSTVMDLSPASVLEELVQDVPVIQLGRGHGPPRRKAFDVWKEVGGEMFNLSGHINVNKGRGITITMFHHSDDPMSFEGTALVLEPAVAEKSFHQTGISRQLTASRHLNGEYRASFTNLQRGTNSFTLSVGKH